jgi:hypothetical protein
MSLCPHDFLVGGVVGEVADEVVDPGCSEHALTKGFVVAAEVGLSREWGRGRRMGGRTLSILAPCAG